MGRNNVVERPGVDGGPFCTELSCHTNCPHGEHDREWWKRWRMGKAIRTPADDELRPTQQSEQRRLCGPRTSGLQQIWWPWRHQQSPASTSPALNSPPLLHSLLLREQFAGAVPSPALPSPRPSTAFTSPARVGWLSMPSPLLTNRRLQALPGSMPTIRVEFLFCSFQFLLHLV
jgi:hypothetical protein